MPRATRPHIARAMLCGKAVEMLRSKHDNLPV